MNKMEIIEIITSIVNGSKRVYYFNNEVFLKECYGDKIMSDILIDVSDDSRVLFFFNDETWTLDDHEIAITLCSVLPKEFLNKRYLENSDHPYSELYQQIYNFLQTK